MRGEHILDLDRIDILAARDEHLLPAAGDVGEAIGVAAGKVARAEPAVGGESRTRRLLVVPVTRRDAGAREEQVADGPVPHVAPFLVDYAGAAEQLRPADRSDPTPGLRRIPHAPGRPRFRHAHPETGR